MVAGPGPPEAGYRGKGWKHWIGITTEKYLPNYWLDLPASGFAKQAEELTSEAFEKGFVDELVRDCCPEKVYAAYARLSPKSKWLTVESVKEGLAHGGTGYNLDRTMMHSPWGIDLHRIQARVQL